MKTFRFKFKRDPAAEWTLHNPILLEGEPGFESDTFQFKIGDGFTRWNSLPYIGSGGGGSVFSVFGRTGAITAQTGDYTKTQVGLGNVDNTSDANKPVSTATATALGLKANSSDVTSALALKADATALTTKANLVSGKVPYSELPLLAFQGSWAGATVYHAGDSVMHEESLFATAAGVAADVAPFALTPLVTGSPASTDTSDADEWEFFSYIDVTELTRMTAITLIKVATQTDIPIRVRLWDRDISQTQPIVVKEVTVASNYAGDVSVPLVYDLLPDKNYAVSFSVGFGSGFGYVYSPAYSFPATNGPVTLRNAGYSAAEGTITAPTLGTFYWASIEFQKMNAGWTRLANLVPSAGAKGDKGDTGATGAAGTNGTNGTNGADGADGADGPPGPQGDGAYPLSGYGFHSASVPIETARSDSTHGAGWATRVYVPAGKAINTIGVFVSQTGGVGSGNNAFAVYDDSGNFVASTPTDNNLWVADHAWVLKNLSSPIAAQGSGRFVYIVTYQNGSATDANIAYLNIGFGEKMMSGGPSGKFRSFPVSGMGSSFPSTINVATPGTNFGYLPLVVLA